MHKCLTLINIIVQITQWFHLVNEFLARSVVLCRVSCTHHCTGISIQAERSAQRAALEPTLNTSSCLLPCVRKGLLQSLPFIEILQSTSSSKRRWSVLHQTNRARKHSWVRTNPARCMKSLRSVATYSIQTNMRLLAWHLAFLPSSEHRRGGAA